MRVPDDFDHSEAAAIKAYPDLRPLILRRNGARWRFAPVRVEGRWMLAGARVWPGGSNESILINSETDAKAFRCDPAGGIVHDDEGGLVDVRDGLLVLPAPGEPGAPVLVKGSRAKLWTPGGGS